MKKIVLILVVGLLLVGCKSTYKRVLPAVQEEKQRLHEVKRKNKKARAEHWKAKKASREKAHESSRVKQPKKKKTSGLYVITCNPGGSVPATSTIYNRTQADFDRALRIPHGVKVRVLKRSTTRMKRWERGALREVNYVLYLVEYEGRRGWIGNAFIKAPPANKNVTIPEPKKVAVPVKKQLTPKQAWAQVIAHAQETKSPSSVKKVNYKKPIASSSGSAAAGAALLGIPIMLVLLIGFVYFLPSVVAIFRRHPNSLPIIVLNLFLGFSVIGWVIPLAWSFTSTDN